MNEMRCCKIVCTAAARQGFWLSSASLTGRFLLPLLCQNFKLRVLAMFDASIWRLHILCNVLQVPALIMLALLTLFH